MHDVVCVGAGWVTNARHIPSLKNSGRCRVVGVVDKNAGRAAQSARKHGIPNHGDSLDAPWAAGAPVFSVGVPPMEHYPVVDGLLGRGKHVLMEKPMCLTVADGERLVEKAAAAGRVLAIVHNFQFARSVMAAKEVVASGRWGGVTAVHGFQWSSPKRRLPHWYESIPWGLFYDESPHLLYLLRAFAGDLKVSRAGRVPSTLGKVTPAAVNVELQGAVPATLFMTFEAPISEWQLMVCCEGGALVIDIFRDILVKVPCDNAHGALDIVRSTRKLTFGHLWGFFTSGLRLVTGRLRYGNDEVVKRFLDAVDGRPLHDVDARSGLEVLRLQHAIMEAAE